MMFKLGKKADIGMGPDALIGLLLVALIGLGGLYFIIFFVNSLSMSGLVNIVDSETDMKCFYMLLPMTGNDYLRKGAPDSQLTPQFKSLRLYLPVNSQQEELSFEFNSNIESLKDALESSQLTQFPVQITDIKGSMGTNEKVNSIDARQGSTLLQYSPCSMPVYGPAGLGTANLYIATSGASE